MLLHISRAVNRSTHFWGKIITDALIMINKSREGMGEGPAPLHLALTLSGRLPTVFQRCDFVSSLQDVFEDRR